MLGENVCCEMPNPLPRSAAAEDMLFDMSRGMVLEGDEGLRIPAGERSLSSNGAVRLGFMGDGGIGMPKFGVWTPCC